MTKTMLYGATKMDETNGAYAAAPSFEQFQWKSRVLVVFSSDEDPRGESHVCDNYQNRNSQNNLSHFIPPNTGECGA
jgi:hypothetical protein